MLDVAAKLNKAMAIFFELKRSKRITSNGVWERADALSLMKFCLSRVKLCNDYGAVYKLLKADA